MWTSLSIASVGRLLRRLEERPDLDVEAEIGEGRGDHLLAAVMAVLADLGDEDARRPAVIALRTRRPAAATRPTTSLRVADLLAVDAGNDLGIGAVAAEGRPPAPG